MKSIDRSNCFGEIAKYLLGKWFDPNHQLLGLNIYGLLRFRRLTFFVAININHFLRNLEYLTGKYQSWILDLIPVGLIDGRISNSASQNSPRDTPQIIALAYDDR
jgi:hypothetical protein